MNVRSGQRNGNGRLWAWLVVLLVCGLVGATAAPVHAEQASFPPQDSRYHTYGEMVRKIRDTAQARPRRVDRFWIGRSHQGRPIWATRLSLERKDDKSEPGVLFVASHHAREHLTVEVALELLRFFAWSPDRRVLNVLKSRQIYIVFNLNPDGSQYDISGSGYRYWRKNRQPHPNHSAIGTDLNRNYGYRWGCCGGSSPNPASETYRGWRPFSAPETRALRDFVEDHPNIRTSISYHSYGEVILYPYGYTKRNVPPTMTHLDRRTFVSLADYMSRTNGYRPMQSSQGYITDGDFIDWMYGEHGIFAFTFELGGGGFYPPDEFINREAARNRQAALYMAQIAGCPYRAVNRTCE